MQSNQSSAVAGLAPDTAPLEVLPRDISAYRLGNTGIDYVHRFESGKPGPDVLVNGLTHGNEICGMVAVTYLLDRGVRPLRGSLTISLANFEAYNAFDCNRPYENRQLVHNLNRIWDAQTLNGSETSPELRRARELRPVLDAVDHVLDIHSTRAPVQPFWVYPEFERNARLATAIGEPTVHLVMPVSAGPGTGVVGYGRHGELTTSSGAVIIECGQHFSRAAADFAVDVTMRFLRCLGIVAPLQTPHEQPAHAGARRFRLLHVHVVRTLNFRFVRPLLGFESFEEGDLIAVDSDLEIRAPCRNCTVFMPTQQPIVGREGVYLTVPL